jgi:hypothetical protein
MSDAAEPKIPESLVRADVLLGKLLRDGTMGSAVRKLAKETFPEAGFEFPEDRFDAQLQPLRDDLKATRDALEAEREQLATERKTREEATQLQSMQQKLDSAVAKYSLTADGAQKMVDRMQETGNSSDFEAAAAWVAGNLPKAVQTSGAYLGPQALNLFGSKEADENFKLLHKDPMGAFIDNEMREFVSDPDAYVRSAGFAA